MCKRADGAFLRVCYGALCCNMSARRRCGWMVSHVLDKVHVGLHLHRLVTVCYIELAHWRETADD